MNTISIKRTQSSAPDFRNLVTLLDKDLYGRYNEAQSLYDRYNTIDLIETVVIVYVGKQPVGCGCFKKYDDFTIEIKRMFVKNEFRGKGLSKSILNELVNWARELGYSRAVLETGTGQHEAISLYTKSGFKIIPNYGPYAEIQTSMCFEKELNINH